MATDHERAVRERFAERYATARTELVDEIEARVIGAAWGANGYTTVAEADELARRLALGPDVPVAALAAASARARREGLERSGAFVAASRTGCPSAWGPRSARGSLSLMSTRALRRARNHASERHGGLARR